VIGDACVTKDYTGPFQGAQRRALLLQAQGIGGMECGHSALLCVPIEVFRQLASGHAALDKERGHTARGLRRVFVMNDRN
jgi:hypothetical protein